MELLLNLSWLLLALPAFWLWRESTRARGRRRFSPLHCVFALAGVLVILFPVVSATDDLRAMRAEVEETPLGKRSVGTSSGEKASASKFQSQPAIAVSAQACVFVERGWVLVAVAPLSTSAALTVFSAGRAPPRFFIG